jgi:hypothetical protein
VCETRGCNRGESRMCTRKSQIKRGCAKEMRQVRAAWIAVSNVRIAENVCCRTTCCLFFPCSAALYHFFSSAPSNSVIILYILCCPEFSPHCVLPLFFCISSTMTFTSPFCSVFFDTFAPQLPFASSCGLLALSLASDYSLQLPSSHDCPLALWLSSTALFALV